MPIMNITIGEQDYEVTGSCNVGCLNETEIEFSVENIKNDESGNEIPKGSPVWNRVARVYAERAKDFFCPSCADCSERADLREAYLKSSEGRLEVALDEIEEERKKAGIAS